YKSFTKNPIKEINYIWVYCDGNNATLLENQIVHNEGNTKINFKNYSAFSIERLANENLIEKESKNIILNLRGVNNKRDWLNNPLNSLEIQMQSCSNILNSDFNLYPNTKLVHFSSQLCDLIESNFSLKEICEGEDSYRSAYMVSRLHQEALLRAYAYKNAIETKFVRMPAVYGFDSDINSPWIITSLIKEFVKNKSISLRKPELIVWLTHKKLLIDFIRQTIVNFFGNTLESNVSYLNCPMLGFKLKDLSILISKSIMDEDFYIESLSDKVINKIDDEYQADINSNLNVLESIILEIYQNAK
ncbi:NAD-dependent epimerase/dehydratase family protein, partial [Prochlorococcus sp. AH-716-M10]|nr:NAD-dependent epimerase/dehydratase family protein [Prochlorococcus sp. AH-716-M10]